MFYCCCFFFFFLMIRRPPRSTQQPTLFPYTTPSDLPPASSLTRPVGVNASRGVRDSGRSEEHTSELQSPVVISYAVFCLKKTKKKRQTSMNLQISINVITSISHLHT